MKAELVPENGEPPIPIVRDLTIVGRREYCDVVIDHHSLSKRHCILVKTDGLLVIRDLATTNGTKVKGQKVRWAALLPDDRVSFGGYKVRVYLGPDDVPSPSEQYQARAASADPAARGTTRMVAPSRSATAGAAAWSQSVSPTATHRPAGPGFAEPSKSGVTQFTTSDPAVPAQPRRAPARHSPPDDDFQFEILEDDDEIIELD
jgi:predicted component of type VI protein secretion system